MHILAHRGVWNSTEEQNDLAAFEKSYELGCGLETDLRKTAQGLVISHDHPGLAPVLAGEAFFEHYAAHGQGLPLALNIKEDGLQDDTLALISKYDVTNYFVFDMAVPDAVQWRRRGAPCFTRLSEYETRPAFPDDAVGVWIDGFETDWIEPAEILAWRAKGLRVALVSSELHKRDHQAFWARLRGEERLLHDDGVALCTDHVERALDYFGVAS